MDLKTRIEVLPCGMCEEMMGCDTCLYSKEAHDLYYQIRAEVIEELFNIHCKDVSQNECDGYGGRCYQCKYERLVRKSLEMQELKFEEQK